MVWECGVVWSLDCCSEIVLWEDSGIWIVVWSSFIGRVCCGLWGCVVWCGSLCVRRLVVWSDCGG